jgi:hypothetical protein
LTGFFMCQIARFCLESATPGNAIEIKAFAARISACWRVHVTPLAHETRIVCSPSVR